jgi:GDP/UDP-N,N'-diacetylbacillosamine 2-epimerase (hydrolysing)
MKIAVLTSSRADYSIYYPLLKKLISDEFFDLSVIAFGTHLSETFGKTVTFIEKDGFNVSHKLETVPADDSPKAIADSMGKTISLFSKVWSNEKYDLVFALGDRFEMFSAVSSSVPFNLKVAHIHGGETTKGAIDDVFRHSITVMSKLHFTVAEDYKNRVISLTANQENVYNVGSLSIDNLKNIQLYTTDEFFDKFNIDLNLPSVLITFHPETVSYERNQEHIAEFIEALKHLINYQLIITMPNADTMGNMIRNELHKFITKTDNAIGVESFGTIGYLTAMKNCRFMLGNTSSGFVEASFFPKPVINLGNRQQGRIITSNIFNCAIRSEEILNVVKKIEKLPAIEPIEVYGKGDTADKIVSILKSL